MTTSLRIAISGASGRMGRSVARLCQQADDLQIVGACASPGSQSLGHDIGLLAGTGNAGVEVTDDVDAALLGADVVVDFSLPPAVESLAVLAARQGIALVSGTTGITDTSPFDSAAREIPVVWAPNMSLGIAVLSDLVAEAARRLGPDFDIEITDVHHRRKVDSPSGTAVRLADAVKSVRPVNLIHGREGNLGARTSEEIGIFGLRGGDVIGDHTVHLLGTGERLELTHRATDRILFARGAIVAARWISGKKPGRYTLADVLSK